MTYHRRHSGLGATPSFTGDANALPICPEVSSTGFCRPYVGGSPQYRGTPTTVSGGGSDPAKPSSGPSAGDVFGAFLKGLTGGIGTNTMTPAAAPAPVYMPASNSGPSTTTIVAIGGAALLAILLLTD